MDIPPWHPRISSIVTENPENHTKKRAWRVTIPSRLYSSSLEVGLYSPLVWVVGFCINDNNDQKKKSSPHSSLFLNRGVICLFVKLSASFPLSAVSLLVFALFWKKALVVLEQADELREMVPLQRTSATSSQFLLLQAGVGNGDVVPLTLFCCGLPCCKRL